MDSRSAFAIYYLVLIVASVGVSSSALVCWMVTRHVPDLKYFSRQQMGTTIAHVIEVLIFAILLVAPTTPLAIIAVLAVVPAEMIKLYVWFKLMLSLIGLADGVGRSRMVAIGTVVAANAGTAAAAIAEHAHPPSTEPAVATEPAAVPDSTVEQPTADKKG